MKPYFAKYLPVEGEIKELDYYKHPDHPDKLFRFYEPWDEKREKAQKVKLFLCSRDNPDTPLGEISKRAKWVEENDEFSNDEIGVLWNFVGEDSDDELFTLSQWPEAVKKWYKGKVPSYMKNMITNPIIAVKCPYCGSFM